MSIISLFICLVCLILMRQPTQESTPRIVWIGDNPGCPCGGTHVLDISDITKIKVCNLFTTYTTQQEG
jgi:Ser-tRNA(Ala) deacylase AlaX